MIIRLAQKKPKEWDFDWSESPKYSQYCLQCFITGDDIENSFASHHEVLTGGSV